jgi:GT2 family glycosyltransferase
MMAVQSSAHEAETARRVAVLIVNYNSAGHLSHCLQALARQEVGGFRTIVVDNASTDASADAIERDFPWAQLVRLGRNLGFAAGNNVAAAHAADCDWFITLNPDAFPEPGWLKALLRAAHEHPQYAMFQAKLMTDADRTILDGAGDVYHVSGLHWREAHMCPATEIYEQPREIFSPCAAAAMYRRDAFEQAHGFDEDFFCYAEDVDLGFRLRLVGHRALYVPDAVVYHVGSASTGRRSDFSVYYGQRNLVWSFVKNMPPLLLLAYLPVHVLMNIAAVAILAQRGQAGVAWRAKIDALQGLRPMLAKRRTIQPTRTVSGRELLAVMARGWPRRNGRLFVSV